jgi:hypothetical protein
MHDWHDRGQYQFHREPLTGGRMAFRNFGGYIDSFYRGLQVREIQPEAAIRIVASGQAGRGLKPRGTSA